MKGIGNYGKDTHARARTHTHTHTDTHTCVVRVVMYNKYCIIYCIVYLNISIDNRHMLYTNNLIKTMRPKYLHIKIQYQKSPEI